MGINFFWKNNALKNARVQYVKEFKVKDDIKLEPCNKFVACLEKLSKNYVLALRDNTSIETMQVANQNDIEFFEGYELVPNYTDGLRKDLCVKLKDIFRLVNTTRSILNRIENLTSSDKRTILNDIKLNFSVINEIVSNIYQHLTMTNETIEVDNEEISNDLKTLLEDLKNYILQAIGILVDVNSGIIIEYISKQLQMIIDKILNYYNQIDNIMK